MAFVVQEGRLLSFRDSRLPDFRLLRLRVRRGWVKVSQPLDILLSILDQKVENLADALEDVHRDLEKVGYSVLEEENGELEEDIERLAQLEDTNGKIRLCLMDTSAPFPLFSAMCAQTSPAAGPAPKSSMTWIP